MKVLHTAENVKAGGRMCSLFCHENRWVSASVTRVYPSQVPEDEDDPDITEHIDEDESSPGSMLIRIDGESLASVLWEGVLPFFVKVDRGIYLHTFYRDGHFRRRPQYKSRWYGVIDATWPNGHLKCPLPKEHHPPTRFTTYDDMDDYQEWIDGKGFMIPSGGYVTWVTSDTHSVLNGSEADNLLPVIVGPTRAAPHLTIKDLHRNYIIFVNRSSGEIRVMKTPEQSRDMKSHHLKKKKVHHFFNHLVMSTDGLTLGAMSSYAAFIYDLDL